MKTKNLGVGNFLDGCGQMAFVIEGKCPQGHACTAVANLGLEDRKEVVKAILKFTKMPKADLLEFANDLDGEESIHNLPRDTVPGDETPCVVIPGDRHAAIKAIEAAVIDAGRTQREMVHGQNLRQVEELQKNIETMTGWLMSITGTLYKK